MLKLAEDGKVDHAGLSQTQFTMKFKRFELLLNQVAVDLKTFDAVGSAWRVIENIVTSNGCTYRPIGTTADMMTVRTIQVQLEDNEGWDALSVGKSPACICMEKQLLLLNQHTQT